MLEHCPKKIENFVMCVTASYAKIDLRLIHHRPLAKIRAMEPLMRAHHVITVVAALVLGLGAKQFMFPPQQAEANLVPTTASMGVLQIERDIDMKQLPLQKMDDKTFIFTE